MKSLHSEYLSALEEMAAHYDIGSLYLWPRTPIGDHIQEKIVQRVGATDYQVEHPQSRSARINRFIRTLVKESYLPSDFSVLDIACGDAIVLWQIKLAFNHARCYGLDCHKGDFPVHDKVQRDGVLLYRGFIQHLVQKDPREPFDLVMMLNTYRGWESADLREHEQNLRQQVDAWLWKNARYVVLTVTRTQMTDLKRSRMDVISLGRGEDNSILACFSRQKLPGPWWKRLVGT